MHRFHVSRPHIPGHWIRYCWNILKKKNEIVSHRIVTSSSKLLNVYRWHVGKPDKRFSNKKFGWKKVVPPFFNSGSSSSTSLKSSGFGCPENSCALIQYFALTIFTLTAKDNFKFYISSKANLDSETIVEAALVRDTVCDLKSQFQQMPSQIFDNSNTKGIWIQKNDYLFMTFHY